MEPVFWLVCANSQAQPPPHTEIQLYPSTSFFFLSCPRKMCACVLGGTSPDEHLGKGPAPRLACNLHSHLGRHFSDGQPRTWGMVPEGKCLSGVPTSSLWPRVYSAGALCSFLKWAELHRRTPLSNHPLLLPRTICSGRHRRERGRCYFWILQSIVWLIRHWSVIFLLVETSWLAIPKWNSSSIPRAVPWLIKPRCWSCDYHCPKNNAPRLSPLEKSECLFFLLLMSLERHSALWLKLAHSLISKPKNQTRLFIMNSFCP